MPFVASGAHYRLTDKALHLIDECAHNERQVHKYILSCIERGNYCQASSARALLNAISPFPVGVGCDWSNWTVDDELADAKILGNIRHSDYPCNVGIDSDALSVARKIACLYYLYGSAIPIALLEELALVPLTDRSKAISALSWSIKSLACFDATTQRYSRAGYYFARWNAGCDQRTCSICMARHGLVYRLSDIMVPCHEGCRCSFSLESLDDLDGLGSEGLRVENDAERWGQSREALVKMHAESRSISIEESRSLLDVMSSKKTDWELRVSSAPLVVQATSFDL